jgi:alkylhydroperoxidase family enzyme
MPRIAPLPPKEWPKEMRAALAAMRPAEPRHPFPQQEGRPKGLNALGTLAHHPALTTAFNTFNGYILFASTLSPRQRELLVLRVATVRGSAYEWEQHRILALDNDLSAADVERIAQGPDAPGWAPLDKAMLSAVDEMIGQGEIGESTWQALASELDVQQLMDLVFTVGVYEILAMAFRSFGVELDADLQQQRK